MKRVTQEQLEKLAFTHPGSRIEVDADQGISVLEVNKTTYYASLPEVSLPEVTC